MKILIQLITCGQSSCNDDMEEVKNIILKDISNKLSYFSRDHIHSIEVLGD